MNSLCIGTHDGAARAPHIVNTVQYRRGASSIRPQQPFRIEPRAVGRTAICFEKAESKLNKIREAEATARQNHNILKHSLEHEIAIAEQDLNAEQHHCGLGC